MKGLIFAGRKASASTKTAKKKTLGRISYGYSKCKHALTDLHKEAYIQLVEMRDILRMSLSTAEASSCWM